MFVKDDFIFSHSTARVNYTSYDVRREQDVIHPSAGRYGLMVHTPIPGAAHPWQLAWVLGIFHANIILPDYSVERREFFWVCWFESAPGAVYGPAATRLQRLQFAEHCAFGFVDPVDVIRGCQFLPAFFYGPIIPHSSGSQIVPVDGWKFYYLNRCVYLVDSNILFYCDLSSAQFC
jgi:hypothetical protein